jgi:hypothetical protein
VDAAADDDDVATLSQAAHQLVASVSTWRKSLANQDG